MPTHALKSMTGYAQAHHFAVVRDQGHMVFTLKDAQGTPVTATSSTLVSGLSFFLSRSLSLSLSSLSGRSSLSRALVPEPDPSILPPPASAATAGAASTCAACLLRSAAAPPVFHLMARLVFAEVVLEAARDQRISCVRSNESGAAGYEYVHGEVISFCFCRA